jgi:hypothetical protein
MYRLLMGKHEMQPFDHGDGRITLTINLGDEGSELIENGSGSCSVVGSVALNL